MLDMEFMRIIKNELLNHTHRMRDTVKPVLRYFQIQALDHPLSHH